MNTTILRLRRRYLSPLAVLLMVVLVVLVAVFPFAWTFITSLKPADELYTRGVRYWPVHPTLAGYPTLFQATQFGHYFLNSAVVSVCTVLLGLTVSTSAAYSFSRYRFRGRDGILFGFLIINMFPQILLLVPLLVIMRSLHILNTYLGLILAYSTFTIPFSVWMLTGFLDALPRELEEAARVDGATGFQAFSM